MGRDHTIFAREKGYVTYYKDEEKHPDRKYIGVVFERGMTLPRGRNAARRRRLGLVGRDRQMGTLAGENRGGDADTSTATTAPPKEGIKTVITKTSVSPNAAIAKSVPPTSRKGYMYRPSNWEIGRAAEKAKVKVPLYRKGNRFEALKKRKAKRATWLEKRVMLGVKDKGKKRKKMVS